VSSKESDRSDASDRSDGSKDGTGRHRRLRPSGGYRELRSFQVTTVIYDATVSFCDRFVDKRSRTHDQMVQAARSGRQNIAEGSRASATSSQTELRLVNVARASLDELLLDFEDFLRQRGKRQWKKGDPEARQVRAVGARRDRTDRSDPTDRTDPAAHWRAYARWLESPDPAVVANAVICLIHQANYLLDQQIAGLEREFVQKGGYTEQLAVARLQERGRQRRMDQTDRSDPSDRTDRTDQTPTCPNCGKPMVLRTARQGKQSGSQFWGCSGYPECTGTRGLGSDGSGGSGRSVRSPRRQ
jgi:restriction system protein